MNFWINHGFLPQCDYQWFGATTTCKRIMHLQKNSPKNADFKKVLPLGNARSGGQRWPCWHQGGRAREGLGLEARGADDHLGALGLRNQRFVFEMEVRHGEELNGDWSRGWREETSFVWPLFSPLACKLLKAREHVHYHYFTVKTSRLISETSPSTCNFRYF